MTRTPVTLSAAALVLLVATAVMMVSALPAVAQTPAGASGKGTPPPAGWTEKWAGWWDQGDREGEFVPPGYQALHPRRYREGITDSEKASNPALSDLMPELLLPWARMRQEITDFEVEDSGQICRPHGPFRSNQQTEFQLLVSPEKITVVGETGSGISTGGIRRIYMNRPHLKYPPPTYLGEWVAHWEGDTLVMDGIGFNDKTWLNDDRVPHTEALHIVERWRLVANDEWLEKTITVDDRFALRRPFTVTRYHKKVSLDTPMPFRPRGRDSHVVLPGRVCIDSPGARRGWMKIHKRSLREWDETRKTLGAEVKKTEGQ